MSEEETIAKLKKYDEPILVCNHLIENQYLHLNFPESVDDDQAWCDQCEAILQEEGGWTDRAVKFANLKPCCRCCFAEMRERHLERTLKDISSCAPTPGGAGRQNWTVDTWIFNPLLYHWATPAGLTWQILISNRANNNTFIGQGLSWWF